MKQYSPHLWNRHQTTTPPDHATHVPHSILINKTNNPLERLNRKLNCAFSTHCGARPKMPQFIDTIRTISCHYIDKITRIAKGQEKNPIHQPVYTIMLPSDYA